jgi:hypothetical protein
LRPLLYDPFNPKISVFLDVLPAGVRFDEMKNTFTVNPFRVLLPILFCSIFVAESIILIYAVIYSGYIR